MANGFRCRPQHDPPDAFGGLNHALISDDDMTLVSSPLTVRDVGVFLG
jgi:hypothetical protein